MGGGIVSAIQVNEKKKRTLRENNEKEKQEKLKMAFPNWIDELNLDERKFDQSERYLKRENYLESVSSSPNFFFIVRDCSKQV